MSKNEYIRYILSMLERIDDIETIKKIYMIVQSCFLKR